jgi:hypothetical protein
MLVAVVTDRSIHRHGWIRPTGTPLRLSGSHCLPAVHFQRDRQDMNMHKIQHTLQNLLLMTAAVSLISIGGQALAATAEDLNHDATQALQLLPFAHQAPAHAGLPQCAAAEPKPLTDKE